MQFVTCILYRVLPESVHGQTIAPAKSSVSFLRHIVSSFDVNTAGCGSRGKLCAVHRAHRIFKSQT